MIDLEKNLLTTILLGVCGFCGLMIILFGGWYWLTDVRYIAKSDEGPLVFADVKTPDRGLSALADYALIIEKPVFFPDRQLPEIDLGGSEALADEETIPVVEEPVEPLRAAVAGIIITPEEKIAMVTDEVANKVVILREGMRLTGEQSAWRLEEILDRTTHFVANDGRESTLDLKVNTTALDTNRQTMFGGSGESNEQTKSRAELIRERVAERRAQLRQRASEEQKSEKDDDKDQDD